jgi:tetratricopeptide (TPR) repeat protein
VKHWRVLAVGIACFALGAVVQSSFAQSKPQNKKPAFSPDLLRGDTKAVAAVMLDGALQLAENGSWERIAVGRAWYLGGDRAKGQAIFDGVTAGKKVAGSDWIRLGRVYAEAGEWEKAVAAFDRAFPGDSDDDTGLVEYGALANVNKDRARAEALFARALKKNPGNFWHWVNAGGSFVGVRPQ